VPQTIQTDLTTEQKAMTSFGFNPVVRRPSRTANAGTLLPGTAGLSPFVPSPQGSASSLQVAAKSRDYRSSSQQQQQVAAGRPFPSLATVTRATATAAAAAAAATAPPIAAAPAQPQSIYSEQQQQQQQQPPPTQHGLSHIPFVESVAGTSERERDRGDDHLHWVYATTRETLVDVHSGEELAGPSERVLVVYPMHNDTETGTVQMRLKQIDPTTAQLSLHWVTVYDSSTNERFLGDFSLIP